MENTLKWKSKHLEKLVYGCNHWLFIDDLKLLAKYESVLNEMMIETQRFFQVIGLEMNAKKSATNTEIFADRADFLEIRKATIT